MKERPILFNGEMVRAILDGRKKQTRRVMKPQPDTSLPGFWAWQGLGRHTAFTKCPYGVPGDRLIVKEAAWMFCERKPNGTTKTGRRKWRYEPSRSAQVFYVADYDERPRLDIVYPEVGGDWCWGYKPGRFLPRWASRITLEVVSVRVERLNSISEEDAKAESIERISSVGPMRAFGWKDYLGGQGFFDPVASFKSLWESINGAGSWDANPWVWVVEFKRVTP